jgi:hypothetical protein
MDEKWGTLSGRVAVAGSLCWLTVGCAGTPHPSPVKNDLAVFGVLESHCAPEPSAGRPQPLALQDDSDLSALDEAASSAAGVPSVSPIISLRTKHMAQIIGIDRLIERLPRLQERAAQNELEAQVRLLTVRRQVSDRLLLSLIETGSISAELDCERARVEELAVRLEEVQNDIQHSRTIKAIVGEASLQMAAGVLLIMGLPEIAGGAQIAGNVNALGHGIAALGGEQQTDLTQARNLLGELWEGPREPVLFPESVWRYLNQPVGESKTTTRRETILAVWRARLGEPGSETEKGLRELYFGTGGTYHVPELRHRADMLALLKAFVNLMNQDLNLLLRETLVIMNRMETG